MVLIHVPKPPKSAYDPSRPMSSLLQSQVDHLQDAESKLPLEYCSRIYSKAIRTEGEAAQYIRDVTEAIHRAHRDAGKARTVRKPSKRKGVIEIAAYADERGGRKQKPARKRPATKSRKSTGARKQKK